MIKRTKCKAKAQTEKASVKASPKIKSKIKNKITFSQCGQIGHSKTVCPFIKPKIEKIISKHMRVDWKVPISSVFDVETESNKYDFF